MASVVLLDLGHLTDVITAACEGLKETNPQAILQATLRDIYDGVPMDEVRRSLILSARSLIEKDPEYNYVTSRLLMHSIRREVLGEEVGQHEMNARYADYFQHYIKQGIEAELLDERLRQFDLPRLAPHLTPTATCNSSTSACKPCTTATSCTSKNAASNCRKPSSCAWPWASA
jgi:ribonucleoside-diphosphate reductase alpha chain